MARILVVDDDPQITELIRIALERMGHEVEVALSGHEAIASAAGSHPELILLDFLMPDMTGGEVLEYIRSDPVIADTPVVLATGELDAASGLEVSEVLTKPYKLEELYGTVAEVLGDPGTGQGSDYADQQIGQ